MSLHIARYPILTTVAVTAFATGVSFFVSEFVLAMSGYLLPGVALGLVIGLPGVVTPLMVLPLLLLLKRQRQLREELERLVHTDMLTELPNRRAFFDHARNAFSAPHITELPAAAMMIDVDHFKAINDSYGHDVGDAVLRRAAGVIRDEVASAGASAATVARLGGEEFAVLVSGRTASAVARLADRICHQVHRWVGAGDSLRPVTVSIGVAFRTPGKGIDHLLKAADDAVYAAKANGRDQWSFAGDPAKPRPERRVARPIPLPANDRLAG